jgi:uncharacterized protein (TIGR03790 family)
MAQERRPEADETLVVYNVRDPLSWDLANYYAGKRRIAADRVVGIDCSIEEEISRAEYDRDIAGPLRKIFTDRGWWKVRKVSGDEIHVDENKIRFVALMRGVPLKIARVASYEGDKPASPENYSVMNEAAVDSELACLGFFTRTISGALSNPYFRNFTTIGEAKLPQLMLVCRLDAPTGEIVRRMIDDSIEAEQTGLWGFAYVDSRNIKDGGLAEGDKWLLNIVADAQKHGIPVIHDNGPDVFPDDYPMRHAAFYYGWYADNVCGPFARPDFYFNKGAIACHIHSFSASSVRSIDKFWAGPLLVRGAAAVLGNVYEPFLNLTANLDVFHERIEDGFTFAESAYMSAKVVSWMNTYIGDPLYKPFKVVQDNFDRAPGQISEWVAYRIGAEAWFRRGPAVGQRMLAKSGRTLRSGVIFEGLGLLQAGLNDFTSALISFRQAREFYTDGEDVIRTAIHEVSILKAMGKAGDAHDIAQKVLSSSSRSIGALLLKKLDASLSATPAPAGGTNNQHHE